MREIVRAAKSQGARVVSRVLEPGDVDQCADKVEALADEVEAVLSMEKEEKALGEAERDVKRGENLVGFANEISSRPRRTWFESEAAKKAGRNRGARELNGAGSTKEKKKPSGKLSGKSKKKLDDKTQRSLQGQLWKKSKNEKKPSNKAKNKGKKNTAPKRGGKSEGKVVKGRKGVR